MSDFAELHGVPPLPPEFVERPSELAALKRRVLGGGADGNPHSAGSRVGIFGVGGSGKSVLAAALAHDDEVRRTFADGIFWVVLGRDPDLPARQRELIELLSGRREGFADANQGRARLQQRLRGQRCLIIIDNARRLADIRALDPLQPPGGMLITCRTRALVRGAGATEHPMDALTTETALRLLADTSGEADPGPNDQAAALAQKYAHLPLSLVLIGRMIRSGARSWQESRAILADRSAGRQEANSEAIVAIEICIETLGNAAERYLDLAVFPEDTPIPWQAVKALWAPLGLEDSAASNLIDRFIDAGLVLVDDAGRLRLSPVHVDVLGAKAVNLAKIHDRLVEGYQQSCVEGWGGDADDRYFFSFFAHHLKQAGRVDDLRALLTDDRWLAAKLSATGVADLLSDFALLSDPGEVGLLEKAIGLSARALAEEPNQLPGQLIGRLKGLPFPALESLLTDADRHADGPWLRPETRSLTPPSGALVRHLVGHTAVVKSMVVAAEDRLLVSASADGTVRVWDLRSGLDILCLQGHEEEVVALAVTADGGRCVSASADGIVRLWNLESGDEVRRWQAERHLFGALTLTADDRYCIAGTDNGELRVWELATGDERRGVRGPSSAITTLVAPNGGHSLVGGSRDGTVRVWDIEKMQERLRLQGHPWPVTALAVSADGSRCLSASHDQTIRVWDLRTGEELRCLRGHKDWVTFVALSDNDRRCISASQDGTVRLWEVETGRQVGCFDRQGSGVTATQLAANGRLLISGYWDGAVRLWDLEAGQEYRRAAGHAGRLSALATVPDTDLCLSCTVDGIVRLWDVNTGAEVDDREHSDLVAASRAMLEASGRDVDALIEAETPDWRRRASLSGDSALRVWDTETGKTIATFTADAAIKAIVAGGAHRFVAASEDGALHFLELRGEPANGPPKAKDRGVYQ